MKVLIAIDESSFSDEFCSFVFAHKWDSGTEFIVLNVVQDITPGSYMSILPPALLEDIKKEARTAAEKLLRDLSLKIRDHYHSPRVKELVLVGDPGPCIAEAASKESADLIVLGTHARRGLGRFLMGSVSSYVSAHAHCSVLVVCPRLKSDRTAESQVLAGSQK